jgi:hypothetical protein
MRSLLYVKKIAGARTESKERYSIEFKGQTSVIRQGIAALKGRDWHRYLPFLLERSKTQSLQRTLYRSKGGSSYRRAASNFRSKIIKMDNNNENKVISLYCDAALMLGELSTSQSVF